MLSRKYNSFTTAATWHFFSFAGEIAVVDFSEGFAFLVGGRAVPQVQVEIMDYKLGGPSIPEDWYKGSSTPV